MAVKFIISCFYNLKGFLQIIADNPADFADIPTGIL